MFKIFWITIKSTWRVQVVVVPIFARIYVYVFVCLLVPGSLTKLKTIETWNSVHTLPLSISKMFILGSIASKNCHVTWILAYLLDSLVQFLIFNLLKIKSIKIKLNKEGRKEGKIYFLSALSKAFLNTSQAHINTNKIYIYNKSIALWLEKICVRLCTKALCHEVKI